MEVQERMLVFEKFKQDIREVIRCLFFLLDLRPTPQKAIHA